ncbi:hypothetical protein AYB34_06595 [Leptospira sp. ZV016]|nr:hypothetical protein AYB32_07710 [Leptospira kirschneri]KXZ25183.1 hypothetical protein AYB34_06595 [Leptospira sp. ZV016]
MGSNSLSCRPKIGKTKAQRFPMGRVGNSAQRFPMGRVGNSAQRFPMGRVGNSAQRFPMGRVVGLVMIRAVLL